MGRSRPRSCFDLAQPADPPLTDLLICSYLTWPYSSLRRPPLHSAQEEVCASLLSSSLSLDLWCRPPSPRADPSPLLPLQAKVALTDFLGGGSWADDVEELPTAPAARPEGFSSLSGGGGGDFMSRPDRAEREYGNGPPREELPMPTSPPYTAFLGNLAFDVGETEVESFFDGLKVRNPLRFAPPTPLSRFGREGGRDPLTMGLLV